VDDLDAGERVALVSSNAYAEFDVASRACVVRLPPELDHLPFPGEPLGCAMNIYSRSDIVSGNSLAVVGAGFLGLLLTQLAATAGAHVVVLSQRRYALERASAFGATATIALASDGSGCEQALALTGGRGFDRVIEAVGLQTTLDLASALVAERGRLIIAGYHQDGPRQVDMQQWNWRGIDVVNAHERAPERYVAGIEQAIGAVLERRLDPFPLLTHTVPLDGLDHGFELTRSRPDGFIKALLTTERLA
jgi:threonine dehydrogenase-like Zn-dependent dehydrogenase